MTTVLVVEDDRNLADLYATWLEAAYTVRTAYSGEDALDQLDRAVDAILLDRRMPGLSGDEVLGEIHDREYHCRVAMVTAVEPDFDIIEMGFDDYLLKPVSKDDINDCVSRLVIRSNYDSKLDEYLSLLSKKSAIESKKTDTELDASQEFSELEQRIERLRDDVDPISREFDDDDVAAVLRDIQITSGA